MTQQRNGRLRSTLNATSLDFTGQKIIMAEDELDTFQKFTFKLIEELEPGNAIELQLAQSWATTEWQINRAQAMESTIFAEFNLRGLAENLKIEHPQAHDAASDAKTFRKEILLFNRMSMYTDRLVKQANRIMRDFQSLKHMRIQRENAELAEAANICTFFKKEGGSFDPKAHGFIITVAELEAYIHRQGLKNAGYIADIVRKERAKAA